MIKFFDNLKYNNPLAYLISQIVMNIVLITVMILTLLSYISPYWFNSPLQQEVRGFASEYTIFSPEEKPGFQNKDLSILIDPTDTNTYEIGDVTDQDYYFKVTPVITESENTEINHSINGNVLELLFSTRENANRKFVDYLVMQTALIVGSPEIPLNLDIKIMNDAESSIDFQEHSIKRFSGVFNNSKNTISISEKSLPQVFEISVEGGITILQAPSNTGYELSYTVAENAQFFVNHKEIKGSGIYVL